MILGMNVTFSCDGEDGACGKTETIRFGEEENNSPTIRGRPPGWKDTDDGKILCGRCVLERALETQICLAEHETVRIEVYGDNKGTFVIGVDRENDGLTTRYERKDT